MSSNTDTSVGSKSSSTPDGIDFRFLNFSHPQEAKNAQTRRNVRSHVTTKQHERQRQRVAEQARVRQPGDQQVPSPSTSGPGAQRTSTSSPAVSETDTSSPETSSPVSPTAPPVRINPLELYPQWWHPSLRPVVVRQLDGRCANILITDKAAGPLLQHHGY